MNRKMYLLIIGIVAATAAVSILAYAMLANHGPVITSLETLPDRVLPRGSCQIVCNATDGGGDELSYGWLADGGAISGEGASVTWTAPSSVGFYNITAIVANGHGGAAMKTAAIEVRFNRPPAIQSLAASAEWVLPLGSLNVTCAASDPDGDQLSYEWTATGGNIAGVGPKVTWTAPEEVGVYNVTVVVRDGHGGQDTRFVSLSVASTAPPSIDNLTVTAQEPKYLKKTSIGYKVGKTKVYYIECVTSNASEELSYEWSCTGGELSGEGSVITWTAPNPAGSVTVTVTVVVSDVAGNKASKSIVFEVVSCSSCTFG